jgi:hypothetical protein
MPLPKGRDKLFRLLSLLRRDLPDFCALNYDSVKLDGKTMASIPSPARFSLLQEHNRHVARFSAHVSLLGILTSVGLVAALHVLRPDLDPARRFVSDYAVGPYHVLMDLAFFACGLGILALVFCLYYGVSSEGRSWPGLVLLIISGLCINIAARFHEPPHTSPAILLDTVHDSIVQAGLLSQTLAALAWSVRFRKDSRWRSVAGPALLLALLMALGLPCFALTPVRLLGLAERCVLGLNLLWVCGVLIRLEVLLHHSKPRVQRLGTLSAKESSVRGLHSPEGQGASSL